MQIYKIFFLEGHYFLDIQYVYYEALSTLYKHIFLGQRDLSKLENLQNAQILRPIFYTTKMGHNIKDTQMCLANKTI